jgi:uncharacterized protein (TIGR02284 family)
MISQYSKISKPTQVLKDLIKINNDRIAAYQVALNHPEMLDASICDTFNKIVSEGSGYVHQLIIKIREIDGNSKNDTIVLGKIYEAWRDLKITFACTSRKSIILSCKYNEEIALHAYRAALNIDSRFNPEIILLLKQQEEGLRNNYELLKNFRELRSTASVSFMHLV